MFSCFGKRGFCKSLAINFSTWRLKEMKRKIYFCLLFVLLTGVLCAQQSLVSGGIVSRLISPERYWKMRLLFTEDADAFMDPNDYRSVEFESFFAETQAALFAGIESLSGGAAKRFGQIYTSIFFDGNGENFMFTNRNFLSIMIGTASVGAFKPFFERNLDSTRFGFDWGINFASGFLKPEVMISYDNAKTADYDGLLGAGAALGIEFAPAEGEASFDIQYELKFGIPENSGSYCDHYITVMYRRLYGITDGFSTGWGLGAAGWFVKQKSTDAVRYGVFPLADLGFKYQMSNVFGINGQLLVGYTIDHDAIAGNTISYFGGFDVIPVLGASFTPHKCLKIEMGAQYNNLYNIHPWSFMFLASFKK
jgi:hypothetical protein